MSKEEFLRKLRKYLDRLPHTEIDNAMRYYAEYLEDAENEEEAIAKLGSPYKVASQIIAEYTVKDMKKEPTAKKTFKAFWVVLIATSPITVPLAIAFAAVIFSLLVSLAAIDISFLLSGFFSIIVSFFFIAKDIAAFMFYLGAGAFIFGAGIATTMWTIELCKKCYGWTIDLVNKYHGGHKDESR